MNKPGMRIAKFENLAKAYVSSYRHGTPAFVRMLPTDRCNLQCSYCWQRDNTSTDMSLAFFQAHLEKAKELRVGLMTFLGGEPMLWNPLPEAVALCTEQHVLTDLTTNGTLLTAERIEQLGAAGLDYLNISVDGASASPVSFKTSIFESGLIEALKAARAKHGMHARINSVIYKNNFDEIRTLIEFSHRRDIQLSLGFIVPPLNLAQRSADDIFFSRDDEPLLHDIVDHILEKKRAGYPIIDPDAYFENIFKFIHREKFWECNYPTRYGWINVTPTGQLRSCTKKMDALDVRFLDLDLATLRDVRAILKKNVESCNIDCYSNCAYDSYFYTHNKGEFLKKILHRIRLHH
ncbi:MAG: radical SAM protein [Ignavibacteria bacterium]|nr:radical SAM protein [Ignavibacteria bacterium]